MPAFATETSPLVQALTRKTRVLFAHAKADEYVYLFLVATFLSFAVRDGMTGILRYILQMAHLSVLWFIPDLMAFAATLIFVLQQFFARRNPYGIFFFLAFLFSMAVSMAFMNTNVAALSSSFKMFIPMFVGFAFGGRSVTERGWARLIVTATLIITVAGVVANPYFNYPWIGFTFDTLGLERQATKLWWIQGGIVRYGGFSGDSTMAAFMIIFCYALIARYHSLLVNAISWPFLFYAVFLTTSKTAVGTLLVFVLCYVFTMFARNAGQRQTRLRFLARASFIFILVPPLMIIVLGGVDLTSISPFLASLADRINNTWQKPFVIVGDLFPPGLFLGCGIGCFTYPMRFTPYINYRLPLDSFYLTLIIMMGYPAIFFIYAIYRNIRGNTNEIKLGMIPIFNLYSITVQCFGPSFATLMVGYIFSDVFAKSAVPNKRRAKTISRQEIARQRPLSLGARNIRNLPYPRPRI